MELIQKIKSKKELRSLDDKYIKQILIKVQKQHPKAKDKQLIKLTRAILRKNYGVYQLKERNPLLEQLKTKPNDLELHNKILATHKSSKERLQIYKDIYKKIFKITLKPHSILDIACGLNPISYPYMNLTNINYQATELTKADTQYLNKYFRIKKIKGKAIQKDINSKKYPKADVCFLFKVLETITHKEAESLIKNIKAKYIIASFSTRTIGNKFMRYPTRGWILQMLKRLNLSYEIIKELGEIFYIIKKQ